MPFTLSHAVVAIPFARTALPAGAVAIGSMLPDAPLFLSGGFGYSVTHDPLGALLVDLPAALVCFVAWRTLARPVLRGVLPQRLGERLPRAWSVTPADGWRSVWRAPGRTSRATVLLLVAALLIGILSHLLWDGFTHEGRWGTVLLPALDADLGGIALATWLHYLSSVVGLVLLSAWGTFWLRSRPREPVEAPASPLVVALFWAAIAVAVVVGVVVGARILLA